MHDAVDGCTTEKKDASPPMHDASPPTRRRESHQRNADEKVPKVDDEKVETRHAGASKMDKNLETKPYKFKTVAE